MNLNGFIFLLVSVFIKYAGANNKATETVSIVCMDVLSVGKFKNASIK